MKLSVEVNEMFAENTKDVNDRSRTKVECETATAKYAYRSDTSC